MYTIDFTDLLRRALHVMNCDEAQMGAFDGHSTLELELQGLPSLHLELVGEDVWLWSTLGDSHAVQPERHAAPLLAYLMGSAGLPLSAPLQLTQANGGVELRALLGPSAMQDEYRLGHELETFLAGIKAITEILAQ